MAFPRAAVLSLLCLLCLHSLRHVGAQTLPNVPSAALQPLRRTPAPLRRACPAEASKAVPLRLHGHLRGGQANAQMPPGMKLLIGVAGIYAGFLYLGIYQEDVLTFKSADGTQFSQVWFLQVLEAVANVVVGYVGMMLSGATAGLPKDMFAMTGFTQVAAKYFTSLAVTKGLAYPVAMLAKSGKMVPVMLGSLLLGGASYRLREYLQVACIIAGTALVSMAKKKGGASTSTPVGLICIFSSLMFDGLTGGVQKRLKKEAAAKGVKPKPYDFMFWTNLFMALTAAVASLAMGEFFSGAKFLIENPAILTKIIKFALCSAFGQSFIFYTIAEFDPLVTTTVTTTRKIFTVLLSIFLKGHALNTQGWTGISVAIGGILGELQDKYSHRKPH